MSGDRPSFWSRFLSRGAYPGMPFGLRRQVHILNGVSWMFIAGALAFMVIWLVLRRGPSIVPNLVIAGLGATMLRLLSRRRYQAALILMHAVGGAIFLYQSYFFRTGAHFYLIPILVTSVFLIDRPWWRRSVGFVLVAGYVLIEAYQFGPRPPRAVGEFRYLINLSIGGLAVYGFCAFFREISDVYRRRLDQQNKDLQEAHQAKEKIFSILAHDLRGPVATLKGSFDLLDEGVITARDFAGMRGDLKSGVDSIHASLESLLEWSMGQTGLIRSVPGRIDLRDACAEDLHLLERTARAKGIALENRLPEGLEAWADLHQVHAVFRNLISNALKFTPAGGRVEVTAGEAPGRPGWWRVAVRDTGAGMEPEQAARLFGEGTLEPTRGTAGEKGLGLGLRICRDFVRAHGGEIGLESAPGGGSLFHFTLPAWEAGGFSIPKGGANC